MKRLVLILFALVSVATLVLIRTPESRSKPRVTLAPAKVQANVPETAPFRTPPVTTVDNIEKAYAKAPSLASMEHQYLGGDEKDLARELEQSKSRLAGPKLATTGDSGSLSEQEALLVLTEIRRQHVLSTLLTKKKIENLRRSTL